MLLKPGADGTTLLVKLGKRDVLRVVLAIVEKSEGRGFWVQCAPESDDINQTGRRQTDGSIVKVVDYAHIAGAANLRRSANQKRSPSLEVLLVAGLGKAISGQSYRTSFWATVLF